MFCRFTTSFNVQLLSRTHAGSNFTIVVESKIVVKIVLGIYWGRRNNPEDYSSSIYYFLLYICNLFTTFLSVEA